MVIAFFGHRKLFCNDDLAKHIENAILSNIKEKETIKFYCGGYGDFDILCANVCKSIKKHIKCEIVFVTPYITLSQQRKINDLMNDELYDYSLYPHIEKAPLKLAIIKRNEWIVNEADLIIAYVAHKYGGAYRSILYAKRKKKRIINLCEAKEKTEL